MELQFPIEFLVEGAPVSLQTKRPASRREWRERVKQASRTALPEGYFASENRIAATIFYFPEGVMAGDVDNIVKPILDALAQHIYIDDGQVERVVVQKFEKLFEFTSPSAILGEALARQRPLVYIRLSDNPFEDLA